jgi:long-chain acyl-CoA synthetase
VVFSTSDHIPALLKLKPKLPTLKMIINVDPISSESVKLLKEWSRTQGVNFQELAECT